MTCHFKGAGHRQNAGGAGRGPGVLVPLRIIIVCLLLLFVGSARESQARSTAGPITAAWHAWQEAVARHAPPEELLPLARAFHDALLADPKTPAQKRAKAVAAFELGRVLNRLGKRKQALARLRESAELFESALGPDAPELIDPLWEEARLLLLRSQIRKALAVQDRIDDLLKAQGPTAMPLRLKLHLEKADAFIRAAPFDPERLSYLQRAEQQLRWVSRNLSAAGEMRPVFVGAVAFRRGKMAIMRRNYGAARNRLLKAVAAYRETLPDEDPRVLVARAFLVDALERTGKSDEATEHCLAIGRTRPQRPDQEYLPIFRPAPAYPTRAARAGQEGYVVVSLTVTKEGRTRDITVVDSKPRQVFDRAAIDAAKRFRYAPRFENGEPVETPNVRYIFTFHLKD